MSIVAALLEPSRSDAGDESMNVILVVTAFVDNAANLDNSQLNFHSMIAPCLVTTNLHVGSRGSGAGPGERGWSRMSRSTLQTGIAHNSIKNDLR